VAKRVLNCLALGFIDGLIIASVEVLLHVTGFDRIWLPQCSTNWRVAELVDFDNAMRMRCAGNRCDVPIFLRA
jgi:hypothetical protein